MSASPLEKENSFLKKHFGASDYELKALAGDASSRRYFRVSRGGESWVLMSWEPFDPAQFPFISIQKNWARAGVHVPQITAMDPAQGLLMQEDLSDDTLEQKFWTQPSTRGYLDFYNQTIDELLKIHYRTSKEGGSCTAFEIEFNVEKYVWEMNHTRKNLIEGVLKQNLSSAAGAELDRIFLDVAEKLYREHKVVTHRDFHSRNVMIKDGQACIIDFQDARMGPIVYDLVSLFKDSYTALPADAVVPLMERYLTEARRFLPPFSMEKFQTAYEVQTIQRCFKAAGSFASFFHQKQDRRYMKYLPKTLEEVKRSLALFVEYEPLLNLLEDAGAFQTRYEEL